MILLDTNVVSEPLKPAPAPEVLEWLNKQDPGTLYLSSISLAELWSGVAAMPDGKRRDALKLALMDEILPLFGERTPAFDGRAAIAFAAANASAVAGGNPIGFADCAIAAIANAHGYALATRNGRDFRGTGVRLIDPWNQSA